MRPGAIVWKNDGFKCNLIRIILTFLHSRYICAFLIPDITMNAWKNEIKSRKRND